MDLGISCEVAQTEDTTLSSGHSTDPILTRVLKNIEAIKSLDDPQNDAQLLSQYKGWGGVAPFFSKPEYQSLREELTELVGKNAFSELRASILSSYYTPTNIARLMWQGMARLGFEGGKILEPSAGNGALLGACPDVIADKLDIVAIEKCGVTANVLKERFPKANIINQGFEAVCLPYDYYDAVILNPPFLNATLHDEYDRKLKATEHNFFILKSIKNVRDGGIVCALVTRYFLDATDDKYREEIANKANLIGAYRLDKSTFGVDNTDVITDLIYLQKTSEPDFSTWKDTSSVNVIDGELVEVSSDDPSIELANISSVYINHPQHIIGKPVAATDQFKKPVVSIVPDYEIPAAQRLSALLSKLPKIYKNEYVVDVDRHDETLEVNHSVELMGVDIDQNGVPFRRILDKEGIAQYERLGLNNRQVNRLGGWLEVKACLYALLEAERSNEDDKEVNELRDGLNYAYDAFVGQFGAINSKGNRFMRQCASYSRLAGLEIDYDAGVSAEVAKKKGVEAKQASWTKAPLLNHRMNWPMAQIPCKASSSKDALMLSIQYKGKVDVDYMASLTDKDKESVLNDLVGLIFFNPEIDSYELASVYLSGNIVTKIQQCENALTDKPFLQFNIDALKEVKPDTIEAEDIIVSFGAPWLPERVMHDFIDHLLNIGKQAPVVKYVGGRWQMPLKGHNVDHSKNAITYACEGVTGLEIISKLLHHNSLKIFDTVDDKKILNVVATQALQDAAERIKQSFQDWVFVDNARREAIVEKYNVHFNAYVAPEIDGEILVDDEGYLPYQNKNIKLRPHQLNGIARNVLGKSTLIDVPVGGGKTLIGLFSILLQKRLGLINKAAVVVPNHLISNWVSEIAKFAPETKVLVCNEYNTKKENRELLLASIAYGDYDVIIIARSTFYLIPCESNYTKDFIQGFIDEVEDAENSTDDRMTLRELEKTKHALKNKLLSLINTQRRDSTKLTFETLGIDSIFVDEFHERFKNVPYFTGHNNVGGLGPQEGAMMALDMFMKARYLQKRNDGRGLCCLTGTSITNSPIEVYHQLRYFMFDEALRLGLNHADQFISVFSEPETRFELSASGTYKDTTKIRSFSNVPELTRLMRQFAFVITKDELRAQCKEKGLKWYEPEMRDGKAKMIVCERSDEQAEYMQDLVYRAENLSNCKPKEDNMLKICSDAAKASLDMRLVDASYPKNPNGKLPIAARVAAKEYYESHEDKGVILIFIDLGTPNSKNINLYQEVKDDLISFGVRENEIAFVHDAKNNEQKQVLSDRVNAGEIRILLASTATGGTGLNVQARIVAILNACMGQSWTPAAYEQRLGRGFRSGNVLLEQSREKGEPDHTIAVYNFATDLSLDSFRFGLLETKGKFIAQIKQSQITKRVIRDDDMDDNEDTFAQIKAAVSGNPLILASVNTERDIKTLSLQSKAHWRNQTVSRQFVNQYSNIDTMESDELAAIQRDIARVEPFENLCQLTIGNQHYQPSTEAELELMTERLKDKRRAQMDDVNQRLKIAKQKAREGMSISQQGVIQRLNNEYQMVSRPAPMARCAMQSAFKKVLYRGLDMLDKRVTSSTRICEYRGLEVSLKYQGWRRVLIIEGEQVGWGIEVPKSEKPRIDLLLEEMDRCIAKVKGAFQTSVERFKSIREDLVTHKARMDVEFAKQGELEEKEELLRAIQQALLAKTDIAEEYKSKIPALSIVKPKATIAEDIVLPDSVAPEYGLDSGIEQLIVCEDAQENNIDEIAVNTPVIKNDVEASNDNEMTQEDFLFGDVEDVVIDINKVRENKVSNLKDESGVVKSESINEGVEDTLSMFSKMAFM